MFILFESLKNKSSLTKLIIFVSATRYKYTFSIKHYLLLREDLSFIYILIHTLDAILFVFSKELLIILVTCKKRGVANRDYKNNLIYIPNFIGNHFKFLKN